VPFGRSDLFVGRLVDVGFIGRERKTADAVAAVEIMHFHFIAQMPDQQYFV
jgi:hypothetical protein